MCYFFETRCISTLTIVDLFIQTTVDVEHAFQFSLRDVMHSAAYAIEKCRTSVSLSIFYCCDGEFQIFSLDKLIYACFRRLRSNTGSGLSALDCSETYRGWSWGGMYAWRTEYVSMCRRRRRRRRVGCSAVHCVWVHGSRWPGSAIEEQWPGGVQSCSQSQHYCHQTGTATHWHTLCLAPPIVWFKTRFMEKQLTVKSNS